MVKQYDVYSVSLDPTIGSEIKKTRPCLVISPNTMNKVLNTLIVAPMTTANKNYPSRVFVNFLNKKGQVALDQIKCVDKKRIKKKLGSLELNYIDTVKDVLKEMLID